MMRHTERHVPQLLIALLAATAACSSDGGGSGGDQACTLIGCVDQLTIRPLSPQGSLLTKVAGTVVADGVTIDIQCLNGGGDASYQCMPSGVVITGKPTTVVVSLASGDLAISAETVTPTYAITSPNGPKCDPKCAQATVEVTLGGGLTDAGGGDADAGATDAGGSDADGSVQDGGGGEDAAPSCGDAKVCCCEGDAVTAPVCGASGAWQCPKGFGLFTGADCSATCGGPCSLPCPDAGSDAGADTAGGDTSADDTASNDASDGAATDASDDSTSNDTAGDKDTAADAGGGCCKGSEDCPDGHCISGVCYKTSELGKGQCWIDADCEAGATCKGASTCPCGALCIIADKPGSCEAKPSGCVTIDPSGYGACEMVLGWGFDGKSCVTVSGCGCGDCKGIYKDVSDCDKACTTN